MQKHSRRDLIRALGAAVAASPLTSLPGCSPAPAGPSSGSGGTGSSACAVTATETAGPYPDRLGMIGNQAFYRQDVREGRPGLAVSLVLTVVNVNTACSPIANAAVEIWQCDAEGHYSEYAQPGYDGTGQTFLRGLQLTNSAGEATFTTVYPGWYQGRATHIHVEIFVNGASVKTTQVAFPESVSAAVYATGVYAAKGQSPTTNATDNVFSDGTSTELATLTGDTTNGYTARLQVGVSV